MSTIYGTPANDSIIAASGQFIDGQGGSDTLDGSAGNDELYAVAGNNDRLILGNNDTAYGSNSGGDSISVNGNGSITDIQAAAHSDTISVSGSNDKVYMFGSAASHQVSVAGSGDTVIGSHGGSDSITLLTGSTGDLIDGQIGAKTITDNGAGNNTIYGGNVGSSTNGGSTITGGSGHDLIMGLSTSDSITTNSSGHDTVDGSGGLNTIDSNGSDLIYSGTGGSNIINLGANAHDKISYIYASKTAQMSDTISGFVSGQDTIDLSMPASNFGISVSGGNTIITYNNDIITVVGDTSLQTGTDLLIGSNINSGGGSVINVTGQQTINLGTAGGDTINFTGFDSYNGYSIVDASASNIGSTFNIEDLSHSNTIIGSQGADTIIDTAGNSGPLNGNYIDAQGGNNYIDDRNGSYDYIVSGSNSSTILGGSSDFITAHSGNNSITSNGGDTIDAGNGNNTITAANGDLIRSGDYGNNNITIGSGAHVVVTYAGSSIGHDTISGFVHGQDFINLPTGANYTLTASGSNTILTYGGLTAQINGVVTASDITNQVYPESTFIGLAADQSYNGSGGSDTIFASAGHDTVNIGNNAGHDYITTSPLSASLTIPSDNYASIMASNAGSDTINAIGNYNTINLQHGGNDQVEITYNNSGTLVGHDTVDASNSSGGNSIESYQNNTTVLFSSGNDSVVLWGNNNNVSGGNGNYNVDLRGDGTNTPGAGDVVTLGNGNNTIYAQHSNTNDTITSGSGNDIYESWGVSAATIDLGGGNNTVNANGTDHIYSGTGGSTGNNIVIGMSSYPGNVPGYATIDYTHAGSQTATDTISGFVHGNDVLDFSVSLQNTFSITTSGENSIIHYNHMTILVDNDTNLQSGSDYVFK